MSRPKRGQRRGLVDDIRGLAAQGLKGVEIAARLNCSGSLVSQTLNRSLEAEVLGACSAGVVNRRRRAAPTETCQRPDARKNFETCGDPKKVTPCGERLGVCAYHFETTRPLGGTKL